MPVITLTTLINAPIEKVFDLARSIDLHQESMAHTGEKAVAGRLSGLIEENETVTWEARHFFRKRRLSSRIVSMQIPTYFRDEMIEGDFSSIEHDHFFREVTGGTEMKDVFRYEAPYGIFGKLASRLFLTAYLKKLIRERNGIIKTQAESHQ
ncbi:MAG: hypothetical protein K0Q66_222 [Chitinophagaceae bacterium]|jgi:ligand-binding SRPBCC domain-containing protein|nr:hypothetical protein [Chitinophagaceae bacterium]